MLPDLKTPPGCRLVFSNTEICNALDQLAARLNKQLQGENPIALCVMHGGLVFAGNLIPRLECMLEIDYIHASRYDNQTTGGDLAWRSYPATSLKDRTVLIMDDILDEGNTLKSIIEYCESQGAAKVISTVLLKKMHNRCLDHPGIENTLTDNIALTVEDKYVFGFGMDYNGQYRQLHSIYAVEESDK
ncbi:MAG: hypoxanthine-guanine phosphoribosyltransferase [Gammaproteobacteria bacterium]|jgi:hypoxanthine phosphoribosyltransferase|nr:hypoxanthine-guanine phosphoribosyltransferase [Gammaproteobacteria bacterium]